MIVPHTTEKSEKKNNKMRKTQVQVESFYWN